MRALKSFYGGTGWTGLSQSYFCEVHPRPHVTSHDDGACVKSTWAIDDDEPTFSGDDDTRSFDQSSHLLTTVTKEKWGWGVEDPTSIVPSNSWLTSHLFTCPMIEPILARNGVLLSSFECSMRTGNWRSLLHLLFEMLTVWKNSFVDCIIEDCATQALHQDAWHWYNPGFDIVLGLWMLRSGYFEILSCIASLMLDPPPTDRRSLTVRPSPMLSPILSLLAWKIKPTI